jgi:hypothetical protein
VIIITKTFTRFLIVIAMIVIVMTMLPSCVSARDTMNGIEINQYYAQEPVGKVLHDDLTIIEVCEYYSGPAKGYSALALGERVIYSGPGWTVAKPIRTYIVSGYGYDFGQKLERIPEGALPFEVFFSINQLKGNARDYYFENSLASLFLYPI